MKTVLQVDHASFSYGKKSILQDINFNIGLGEIVCLLGPNGSGKSTLMECLLGIKQLQEGSIFLNGTNMQNLVPPKIAEVIAYVPQLNQISFPFEVMDIVLMGRAKDTKFYSSPNGKDRRIAEESLRIVGMEGYKHHLFTELSGGERQLVMIARALAQKTPVILMDEPTAHLDLHHEQQVLETILQLVQTMNVSIIMATHSPNQAFFFSNEHVPTSVAILSNKKIAYFGTPQEVLDESTIQKVFQIHSKIITHDEQEKSYQFILPLRREVDHL